MSLTNEIGRNINNVNANDLQEFYEVAFDRSYKGDGFGKGFDAAISFLLGSTEAEDIREQLNGEIK